MHRQIILIAAAALLASCGTGISVQNQYFSREDLASFIVGTPDPLRNNPPIGQRLIVQWKFTSEMIQMDDIHFVMTVRLRDYSEETINIPVTNTRGTYIYELCNQRYFDTCGVSTYKIETWACGSIINVWKHQLWVDLITIDQENDEEVQEYDPEAIDFGEY